MSKRKKVTRYLVASDIHWPHVHQPTWDAMLELIDDVRFDAIILAGDLFDFVQLGRYAQPKGQDQSVIEDIKLFVAEVNALAKKCGKIVIISGNHDSRWDTKFLEPVALHMKGLKGFSLQEQCVAQGLTKKHEWIVESHATPGYVIGDMLIHHGHRRGGKFGSANLARSALTRTLGRSQLHGHSHRIEMMALGTHRGTCVAVANGHMSNDHEYSLENQWSRGFTILEHNPVNGFTHPYPIICEAGSFAWGGKLYGSRSRQRV